MARPAQDTAVCMTAKCAAVFRAPRPAGSAGIDEKRLRAFRYGGTRLTVRCRGPFLLLFLKWGRFVLFWWA